MPVASRIEEVRNQISALAERSAKADDLMQKMVKILRERMLKYNWAGFYMLEPGTEPPVLVLGAFDGAATPHTRIPLNQGICGAAASSGKTIVADDVSRDPRQHSCLLEFKSELVFPIFGHGKGAGELDVDSHVPAAFNAEDKTLVQH